MTPKKQITVGWVGSYRRLTKRFDVALHVCSTYNYKIKVAGFINTMLYVPHEKMPDFYRSIDVLLVTSTVEAHPLVVYEALSCGVPVVMLPVGDCQAENIPGIVYYDDLEPEKIAESIEVAYRKRKKMGEAGRAEMVKRWQWSQWIPRYTQMFQDVTGKLDDMKIAIVVDKVGWAWDIMAKILQRELLKTNLYRGIDIYYTKGLKLNDAFRIINFSPARYDVILNHHWQVYNHGDYTIPYEKTILCANGEAYREARWKTRFENIVADTPAITSVSSIIVKDLKKRFRKPVYHCSRGVDTEMFYPRDH